MALDTQTLETQTTITDMTQDTAVVILNWNGKKLMEKFLPSVASLSQGADVVVADNGSTDGSVEWLGENYPTVRVLPFEKNYGFAGGYNLAIETLSEYRYIVLLNSDVEVTDGWVTPLKEYMKSNPDVGACQPKLKSYTDKAMFEYAGAAGGFLDRYGYPFCRGRVFDTTEIDCGQYDGEPKDIFWATGAALMVERETYLQVGGLDTDFFAHMEEIDLCWRMHLTGKRVSVVTESVVYHLGGGTLAAGNPRKTYLNFRNNLFMLYKNLPLEEGKKLIFKRKLLDGVAAMMFFAKLSFKEVKAVWMAHRDFEKEKLRYKNQPSINMLKHFTEGDRAIVFDYYLKGRHSF